MNLLRFDPHVKVYYKDELHEVVRAIDLDAILIRASNHLPPIIVPARDLSIAESIEIEPEQIGLFTSEEGDFAEAQRRYEIIRPLLRPGGRTTRAIRERSAQCGVSVSTSERWLKRWDGSSTLAGLIPRRYAKRGKTFLHPDVEDIIRRCIDELYKTKLAPTKVALYKAIVERCRLANLTPPGRTVVSRRVQQTDEADLLARRGQKKKRYDQLVGRGGTWRDALRPLDFVQIDFSPADIIVVDEETRTEILGRPTIGIAIDAYSRVILGFSLGMEHEGLVPVGACLSLAIGRKEQYLADLGVEGRWLAWGIPRTVHVDNGAAFDNRSFHRACERYGIHISYRPGARPHYGGRVERAFRTLQALIHELEGTTKSSPQDRAEYDSIKGAQYTPREIEQIFANRVLAYNETFHSGEDLKMSPMQKWRLGCIGDAQNPGIGLPPVPSPEDQERIRIALLPSFRRVLDNRGVVIDHIWYYHEVFNTMLTTRDKAKSEREIEFLRDPRAINKIYFWDESISDFQAVPYRNLRLPNISIWEHRAARQRLVQAGLSDIDEHAIFQAYAQIQQIRREATLKKEVRQAAKPRGRRPPPKNPRGPKIRPAKPEIFEPFEASYLNA